MRSLMYLLRIRMDLSRKMVFAACVLLVPRVKLLQLPLLWLLLCG